MIKIGILGGGQLGMLLAQSITRLGAEAIVFDPDPEAPATRTVKRSFHGAWDDHASLARFFDLCDKVTYEFENIPYEALVQLNHATPIFPSLDVLRITQNRSYEKTFLKHNALPHVQYAVLKDLPQLQNLAKHFPFPLIIKSTTGGYDGKSQYFINSPSQLNDFINAQIKTLAFPLLAEEAINLIAEVSCITAQDSSGNTVVFPVFQNVHTNHILDTTTVPADIAPPVVEAVQRLALEATRKLQIAGILCTEFFISAKKDSSTALKVENFNLYINEFAPRPHNSGHITLSCCNLSQFDALARILLDIPLSQPQLKGPGSFCMANLLGEIWLAQGTDRGCDLNLGALIKCQPFEIVLYGKKTASLGRKMGHLITQGQTAAQAKNLALELRNKLLSDA